MKFTYIVSLLIAGASSAAAPAGPDCSGDGAWQFSDIQGWLDVTGAVTFNPDATDEDKEAALL